MKSKALLGLALWWMISLTAAAQTTNQNVRSLSLQECLEMALAHNLDVQIDRYSPEIARFSLRASYGAYDPTLSLTAQRTFIDDPAQFNPKKYAPPANSDAGRALGATRQNSEYELTTDSFGPSLSGLLPSGLSYNLSARSDHLDAITFASFLDRQQLFPILAPPALTNDYYATVGLSLRQPLLKDFWIDLPRRNIQINKKNLKISELTLRGDLMVIVTKVATVYYDLIFAREQINVETTALNAARRLLDDTRRKVQGGALPPLDQQQAESSVESIQAALFAAEQNYTQQENTLKNLLSENFQSWMDATIRPSEDLAPISELPANRAASWASALLLRPDILLMRLDLERQDILLRFNHNQLFPSLDLVGGYGWQAVDAGFGGSWSTVGNGTHPFYSVGVVVSIPLGNVTARNTYKASQVAKKQALLRFQKLQQDVITEVSTGVKLTETTFKQISSTRKAREFSEAAFQAIEREYEAGTKTSYFVVEAQRILTLARFAEIRALADYKIALARLALIDGTTLEKNHVDLAPR